MSDNIIFIIGASSDIGMEFIRNIDEGSLIIAHYNSSGSDLKQLAGQIKNQMVVLKADLSIEKDVFSMLDTIERDYGVPNKIVQLGSASLKQIRFKDLQWKDFEKEISVGLKSTMIILNRFLPKLAKEKRGKVVVMLSSYVMGVPPMALAHYTTAKYAMLGLVKSLASEYSSKNIQINAISPSMIDTKFLQGIHEKVVELTAYNHPLKRNASVNDITPLIKFLLSSDSSYMTGTNIPVSGGSVF